MKCKRRKSVELPPRIKSFIDSVISSSLDNIEEALKCFTWEFDKGDFLHWVALFNHFDLFFEKYIKPRKDLHIEDNSLEPDPPFPREPVLQILRVTRIVLENCTNKHLYSSYEHLSLLLASPDADVIEASLQVLASYLKKAVAKCCIRDTSLASKLFTFSQGWGGKVEGLGLVACSLKDGCGPVASEIGSTLHFEFYAADDELDNSIPQGNVKQGLQVIHLPNINLYSENDFELLNKLVKEYNVPPKLRFSLLTRLRFARAFSFLSARHQYTCIRLFAFIVLVQISHDSEELTTYFNNEPEFISELVSTLSFEDEIPEKNRILAILSLVALCQDRPHQPMVLTSVTSGGNQGILPSLIHKVVNAVTGGSTRWSIDFVEALLLLVNDLVTSTTGSLALCEAGFIPAILPLLKDTSKQHLCLVTTAVHVLEGFLDYNNPATTLFRDLGGLDDTITRLKVELSFVEEVSLKLHDESSKGKQVASISAELDTPYSVGLVSYHRRLLLKGLLRTISLAAYVPGSSARIGGSEESVLPHCLSIIFRKGKAFGGGVFSLAANVMNDLIHRDPTCFPILDAADLPRAFLDCILDFVPCSYEAVRCIPQCLDALCLNNNGLQQVRDRNALRCFVKIFTSSSYLRALSEDTVECLSTSLDELMRHASSLRSSGVDMLIEILSSLSKIGLGTEFSTTGFLSSSTPIPMEIDLGERPASLDEVLMLGNSDQTVELCSDVSAVNVESFLLESVRNAARLLQHVLHNADSCVIFIEKKGIEAVLKLFTMPLMPSSVSIGQNISAAFKGFPSVHYASLSRAVCCCIRDHLKVTNEMLVSVCGSKLAELESSKQMEVLKCLSTLEGLLSLSNFLLKGVITMVSEVGSSNADIVVELGTAYKEILWQISLFTDSKADEKRDTDQGVTSLVSNVAGRESDDDGNSIPEIRYTNPIPIRNNSGSIWTPERDFASLIRSSSHRHGRHGFSRVRGSRISRQLDISHTDSDGSISPTEHSFILEPKKRSPSVLVSEIMIKLGAAIRSFHGSLVKTLTSRYSSLSTSVSKSVVTALAKLFYDALSYSGHSTSGHEMSLSVKCRYLGKVVDDMAALTFDSRRRVCYTLMINGFYVNGTFKELLTTYAATSQLLWTLPFALPAPVPDQGNSVNGIKLSHSSWLLDTLQSYSRLLEHHVNSSLLLSHSSTQAQNQADLLVQPVPTGLSIGLFSIPRDPEQFVRMLHSQVLEVILPVWNHTMFPNCNSAFVTSVISIVTHIYSGVRDLKHGRNGITRSTGQRHTALPLDESTIATIVEMGFPRTRAEEALRSVRTNSVEVATDWLFSHPEEPVQEDAHLVQELALSLGNPSETSKDDISDEQKTLLMKDREVETPPVGDILAVSMKLFQSTDSFAFPLTDLLLTLCNRNRGKDRPRVVLYLIQQLKLCPSDFAEDTGTLCSITHLLALLLRQSSSTREIAADNGAVSIVLDILTNFRVRNESKNDVSATKAVSALLLMLDNLLQSKLKVQTETVDGSAKSLSDPFEADFSVETPSTIDKKPPADDLEKDPVSVFEKILGKSTGYLSLDESQRALVLACDLIKQHVPAMIMQSVLQMTARLTKTHSLATQFLDSGGLSALLTIPVACMFPGFDSFASSILRHLLEDPQTLQTAMELEIRQTILGTISRNASRLSPRVFLTSMAPVMSRDPAIFMRAAAAACQLESSGGRMFVVLSKEKEKDKEKLRASDNGVHSNDSIRMSEQKNDTPGKFSKSHKRVPTSLSHIIDQLLEIIMSYPSPEDPDVHTSSLISMELDEPSTKEKGKSKVDERKMDMDSISEKSALLAKVTFVMKLMSDILLMYLHAVGVLLRRDSEMSQQKGSGQAGGMGNGGILHHILHHLLPLSSDKTAESSDEWKDNLSEKASCFLVALCGRSSEGRRRVIFEIVRTFSSLKYSESNSSKSNSSKSILTPDNKVLAFTDLVNSILAKNSSSNIPGPGCSLDIAKTMIDGGMVQTLSAYLRVVDLDHPDSPKVVNLILKALESLTRAANASDPVFKLDVLNKKRSTQGAIGSQTIDGAENSDHDQNAVQLHEAANVVQTAELRVPGSPRDDQNHDAILNQSMDQDEQVDREDNSANNPAMDEGVEYMQEMDVGGALQNTALDFRVEHRTDDDMGDDDDEDMGDDGEDDDEEDEEDDDDEDIAEEGAALMSLADTDVEDHDGTGIDGEYIDDMIDEDGDFSNNRAIEVRLRDGLAGFDRLRVLRSGDASSFVEINAEPFPRINTDELFPLHRPLGVERRRQSGNRSSTDRSVSDGSSFPHPLFLRPSQSGSAITSVLSSAGNTARELGPLSFGSFDVAQIYMFDARFPSDHTAGSGMGDRLVGASPLSDFPLGMDLHTFGRRGGGSRWTDDGQPQIGGHAAAASIAQAVEAQFVSQLHGVTSLDDPSAQRQTEYFAAQANQQSSNANSLPLISLDNLPTEPSENQALEHMNSSVHQLSDSVVDANSCPSNMSFLIANAQSVVGEERSHVVPERSSDVLDVGYNGSERMHSEEGSGPSGAPLDVVPETDTSLDLQNVVLRMLDNSDVHADSHNSEFQNGCRYGPSDSEIHSTSHALVDSCSTMPHSSDANAISAHTNIGVDVTSMDTIVNEGALSLTGYSGEDLSTRQGIDVPLQSTQMDQSNVNDASNANAIDPTFLEALPEDLRAEVLASQQAQSAPSATYAPPHAEEIDPEFLAALPPDIQAEVLAQQRAQRTVHSQQGTGQPVDMDNASIIATFPPDLREEVLLTSSEAVLSALPSALLAEAQMLRDRAASHYHARSSLFGGSHRFGGRRMAVDRHTVMDRGVGFTVGERAAAAISSSMKVREVEGMPLLDENALKALIRLLRLAQPLGKGLLQRLLLNLCANSVTRTILVGLLVDMIRLEADGSSGSAGLASHRLYGCQWNVVYGRTQPADGLPPLVSRRILETLTYLATNHSSVANILFYLDRSLIAQSPTLTASENKKEKGKEKVHDAKPLVDAKETSQGDVPLILFLKLLKRPLFLRSSAHLEQVMGLLQVVVHNVLANIESQNLSGQNTATDCSGTRKESSSSDQNANLETNHIPVTEVPTSGSNKAVKPYDVLLELPEPDLQNLCSILAQERLSDKVYMLAADILKKLAFVVPSHRKFFLSELAGLAYCSSASAVGELTTLRSMNMLGLNSGSMAGAAILRVLQALGGLISIDGNKIQDIGSEHEEQSILWNLNASLEPLWQELSECITLTEAKLGQSSSIALPVPLPDSGDIFGGYSSLSPPLPPGTQHLLPFIEAFFVLCEKLQTSQTITSTDTNVTAREVKECASSSLSPSLKCGGASNLTFLKIAEKHKRLLNVFIRQNPGLLEKSLSMMLKVPRLIDFDNKRAYFRSRVRQRHDQHSSAPLRISVQRAYVLEDSYNQLRLRPSQDLKGRLSVQFLGEEGIDAGGLTREWYQLLSRVIFDKGALLFTTVGNNATFQPNPNSVYQTGHLSYFKFVGRVVAKALFDGQLLDVYFTRPFYKHILGVKVTYHDIEAVDPDYYKNLKWMLENDVSDIPDLTFSMDADEEKHILYEKTEVTDYELIPGGRNIRVTEETKYEYVDLVAEHRLTTAIRPQINSFLEGFSELIPRDLISIFNDKELELLISGLPEIDIDDLKANTEYTGYTAVSTIICWFWDVVKAFNEEDMARFLQFVTGTSKVPLDGFKALQGISGPQRFQIHKAYGAPERLPSAHTCFNQLDLPEYSSKEQLEGRLLLAIHEASEGFGFG